MSRLILWLALLAPAVQASDSVSSFARAGMEATRKKDWSEAWYQFHSAVQRGGRQPSPELVFDAALAADQAGGRELQAVALYRMFLALTPTSPHGPMVRRRCRELESWTLSWARSAGSHALKALRSLEAADSRLKRDPQYETIKRIDGDPNLTGSRTEILSQLARVHACAALPAGDPSLHDSARSIADDIKGHDWRARTLAELGRMRLEDDGPEAAAGILEAAAASASQAGTSYSAHDWKTLRQVQTALARAWVLAREPEKGRALAGSLPSGKDRAEFFAGMVDAHIRMKDWAAAETDGRSAASQDPEIGSLALASLAVEKTLGACQAQAAGLDPCWKAPSLGVVSALEDADRAQDAGTRRGLLVLALQAQAASGDMAAARATLLRIPQDDRAGRALAYAALAQGAARAGDRGAAKGAAAMVLRLSDEPEPLGRAAQALAAIGDLRGAALAADRAHRGRPDILADLTLGLKAAGLERAARRTRGERSLRAWDVLYSEASSAGWNPWTSFLGKAREKISSYDFDGAVEDAAWTARGLACLSRDFHRAAKALGED
ncbi:MAG: hypothetical protein HY924_08585 [Elusimicrobia bacterium]|nr:hypothetical protein [Elusimicrobiota bacterium]